MNNGTHIYYTIQLRRSHESPWLQLHEPLQPIIKREWSFISWDHFGWAAEPWTGGGNDHKPQFPDSHKQTHNVWANTGCHGWWSADYALAALKRLKAKNEMGAFNSKDGYGAPLQAVRYEFKIVKVILSRKVEDLTIDHLVEAK